MKRDAGLFRDILLELEDSEPPDSVEEWPWKVLHVSGRTPDEIQYHVQMLIERAFLYEDRINLLANDHNGRKAVKYLADAVTNAGHEFLDTVRSPEVWRRTKDAAAKIGVGGIEILVKIATATAVSFAKEKLGLDLK